MRKTAFALFGLFSLSATTAAAEVTCSGASGHLGRDAICSAARAAFGNKSTAITVDITNDEPNRLSARLSWSEGGKGQQGPRVDVTSADKPLDSRAVSRLIQGLQGSTDLP